MIAVLNFSHLPNSTVQRWTTEVQRQVTEDFAPHWHLNARVEFYGRTPPPGAWEVRILDATGAEPQAGYHIAADDHGTPYANVYNLRGFAGVSTDHTMSHEVLEMLANPYDDRYIEDYPWMWFAEVVDPVQWQAYYRNGVRLSDFVFPAWFDALTHDGIPLDFLHTCDTPGHPSDGKAIRLDERTGRREVIHD